MTEKSNVYNANAQRDTESEDGTLPNSASEGTEGQAAATVGSEVKTQVPDKATFGDVQETAEPEPDDVGTKNQDEIQPAAESVISDAGPPEDHLELTRDDASQAEEAVPLEAVGNIVGEHQEERALKVAEDDLVNQGEPLQEAPVTSDALAEEEKAKPVEAEHGEAEEGASQDGQQAAEEQSGSSGSGSAAEHEAAQKDGLAVGITEAEAAEVESKETYLEEETYPTTTASDGLEVGSTYSCGDETYIIEKMLAGGWYRASQEDSRNQVLLRTEAQDELWGQLPNHRLLPSVIHNGPDGLVLPWVEGEPLTLPLPLDESLNYTLALAQLLRFFEGKRRAVLHIDPEGLVLTESGLKLRYLPYIAPIGEALTQFYREGYTAPEVSNGETASGKEGVYLLAALLLQLLTGKTPPPEGPSQILLTGLGVPGLPQLLSVAFADVANRISPEAFVQLVKGLKQQFEAKKPVILLGAATTVGLNPSRLVNEDSYGYVYEVLESYAVPVQVLRACVADGMGGEAAGEVASQAAVQAFCSEPVPPFETAQVQAAWTVQAVWKANDAVLKALAGLDGGCTFTAAVVIGNHLSIAHVGDTRAYLYTAEGLRTLTKDHSLVSALVASGMMTEAEAETSPDKNKVLRSLGSVRQRQDSYVDDLSAATKQPVLELEPGATVIIVSDGVWGELDDKQLLDIASCNHTDPQALADALIRATLEEGAPDNATALVLTRFR